MRILACCVTELRSKLNKSCQKVIGIMVIFYLLLPYTMYAIHLILLLSIVLRQLNEHTLNKIIRMQSKALSALPCTNAGLYRKLLQ